MLDRVLLAASADNISKKLKNMTVTVQDTFGKEIGSKTFDYFTLTSTSVGFGTGSYAPPYATFKATITFADGSILNTGASDAKTQAIKIILFDKYGLQIQYMSKYNPNMASAGLAYTWGHYLSPFLL